MCLVVSFDSLIMERYSTTNEFCQRHPGFDKTRLKNFISDRANNGLQESGAIKKYFHNLYINEKLFKEWLRKHYAG